MKIRNGFVSNSSSSSFCIYGVEVYWDSLLEQIPAFAEKVTAEEEEEDYVDQECLVDDLLKNSGLSYVFMDDYVYIGLSPESMKDDETGLQFKNRAKEALSGLGINNNKIDWFCEVIYG